MELLTVLAIIALLMGILLPSVRMVRNMAKETKQKAQFTSIELGLTAFRNDYGDYPPSYWNPNPADSLDYCGSQKLCEALLGWDLMGFHPDSAWRANGLDSAGGNGTYDPDRVRVDASLYERKDHYIELATANVFRLGNVSANKPGLFNNTTVPLNPDTFVICDSFGVRRLNIGGKIVRAGTPILYYKANTSSKRIDSAVSLEGRIYDARDNWHIVKLGKVTKDGAQGENHPKFWDGPNFDSFYDYITDPRITTTAWPHRPDSYLLISAGLDGLYGTEDDIRNW